MLFETQLTLYVICNVRSVALLVGFLEIEDGIHVLYTLSKFEASPQIRFVSESLRNG